MNGLGCMCCGSINEKLKACSKCKAVHYCSHRCQSQDWTAGHRDECKILQLFLSGAPDRTSCRNGWVFANAKGELDSIMSQLDSAVELQFNDDGRIFQRQSDSSHTLRLQRLAYAQQVGRELASYAAQKEELHYEISRSIMLVLFQYAIEYAHSFLRAAPHRCVDVVLRVQTRLQRLLHAEADFESLHAELEAILGQGRALLGQSSSALRHFERALSRQASSPASSQGRCEFSKPLALHSQMLSLEAAAGEVGRVEAHFAAAAEAASGAVELWQLRLQLAVCYHRLMHESRMACAELSERWPQLADASARADIADDAWDVLVESERKARLSAERAAQAYETALAEAVEADAPARWSRAAALFSHYLLASSAPGSVRRAQHLAKRVLRLHACSASCADAHLAGQAVVATGPLPADWSTQDLLQDTQYCPTLDLRSWGEVRERELLGRELAESW
mmetsp:Transcript_34249/g.65958  ORF Transcript_34249/g.65958 Transcript_34249/m.65958 type:complete len:452 (-) Transcript_34249:229-1584(-)